MLPGGTELLDSELLGDVSGVLQADLVGAQQQIFGIEVHGPKSDFSLFGRAFG